MWPFKISLTDFDIICDFGMVFFRLGGQKTWGKTRKQKAFMLSQLGIDMFGSQAGTAAGTVALTVVVILGLEKD